jgi:hypothetical protein
MSILDAANLLGSSLVLLSAGCYIFIAVYCFSLARYPVSLFDAQIIMQNCYH